MNWIVYGIPAFLMLSLIGLTIVVTRERLARRDAPKPVYYVRHPDGTFTPANPQP